MRMKGEDQPDAVMQSILVRINNLTGVAEDMEMRISSEQRLSS